MSSIYLMIFALGNIEIGYVTGKTGVCATDAIVGHGRTLGPANRCICRDTGIPFRGRRQGHDPLEPTKIRDAISATHSRA
jgi:hypothetical protein